MRHPALDVSQGRMCQFEMATHVANRGGEMGLVKRPTGFMASSRCLIDELNKECEGCHDHVLLIAGSAAGAASYSELLCEAICRGVARQNRFDNSKTVTTG